MWPFREKPADAPPPRPLKREIPTGYMNEYLDILLEASRGSALRTLIREIVSLQARVDQLEQERK